MYYKTNTKKVYKSLDKYYEINVMGVKSDALQI